MGGFGSGNRYQFSKRTTESCLQLDIRHLQRENLLHPGGLLTLNSPDRAPIHIEVNVDRLHLNSIGNNVSQDVEVLWTGCNLGGKRAWFLCPIKLCEKRVAILYSDDGLFACRHCLNLVYRSQHKNYVDRLFFKVGKIRAKLGWPPGIVNGEGLRPKGMHYRTYWKMMSEYDLLVGKILGNSLTLIERLKQSYKST